MPDLVGNLCLFWSLLRIFTGSISPYDSAQYFATLVGRLCAVGFLLLYRRPTASMLSFRDGRIDFRTLVGCNSSEKRKIPARRCFEMQFRLTNFVAAKSILPGDYFISFAYLELPTLLASRFVALGTLYYLFLY